jgi:uncharacterized membrane protein (UPF0127 family)
MTSPWRLVNRTTGETVADPLEIADGFWSRFRGLQLRAALAPGSGLLLVPCPSIHTFMMRFPIDVVMLDRTGAVIALRRAVRPWRIVAPVPDTYAILELPAETLTVGSGDLLRLEPGCGKHSKPPRSVHFLLGYPPRGRD